MVDSRARPARLPYAIFMLVGGVILLIGKPLLDSDVTSLFGAILLAASGLLGNVVALTKGALWDRGGFAYFKDDPIYFSLVFFMWFVGGGLLLVMATAALWLRLAG